MGSNSMKRIATYISSRFAPYCEDLHTGLLVGLFVSLLIFCVGLLSGCRLVEGVFGNAGKAGSSQTVANDAAPGSTKNADGEIKGNTIVLMVGDIKTTYEEVLLYFRSYKQKIEATYGREIWDYELDESGTTYAGKLKDILLEDLIYVKTVCAQSELLEIWLAEDEKLDVKEYVADYVANFSYSQMKEYGFTEETVRKIYEENLLANNIYERLILNMDTDVDDEEVRNALFQYIFISKYKIGPSGTKSPYMDEEMEELTKYVDEVRTRAQVEDFYLLAKECTDDDDEIEILTTRGEMDGGLADVAFGLKKGEVSDVYENEQGYFIFYCKDEKDERATELAKEALILELQREAFQERYSEWKQNTKISLNEQVWARIEFEGLDG